MSEVTIGDVAQLASAGGLGAMAWFFVWKLHPELVRIREVMAAVLEHLRKERDHGESGHSPNLGDGSASFHDEEERKRKLGIFRAR